jgi:hypothetical protein
LFKVSSLTVYPGLLVLHLNLQRVNNESIKLTNTSMFKMTGNGLPGRGSEWLTISVRTSELYLIVMSL